MYPQVQLHHGLARGGVVAVLTHVRLGLHVHRRHVLLQAFTVGEHPVADLAGLGGEPVGGLAALAVLLVDDLVVLHLAQLLEALAAHVTGVGAVVAVDLLVNAQLVQRVRLVVARIALRGTITE